MTGGGRSCHSGGETVHINRYRYGNGIGEGCIGFRNRRLSQRFDEGNDIFLRISGGLCNVCPIDYVQSIGSNRQRFAVQLTVVVSGNNGNVLCANSVCVRTYANRYIKDCPTALATVRGGGGACLCVRNGGNGYGNRSGSIANDSLRLLGEGGGNCIDALSTDLGEAIPGGVEKLIFGDLRGLLIGHTVVPNGGNLCG